MQNQEHVVGYCIGIFLAVTKSAFRPCLDVLQKNFAMESCEFEVLNEVYLQNFLHRWVVNRETNLMMLINP